LRFLHDNDLPYRHGEGVDFDIELALEGCISAVAQPSCSQHDRLTAS